MAHAQERVDIDQIHDRSKAAIDEAAEAIDRAEQALLELELQQEQIAALSSGPADAAEREAWRKLHRQFEAELRMLGDTSGLDEYLHRIQPSRSPRRADRRLA